MTELDANRIHYDEIRVIGSFSYHPDYHARALQAARAWPDRPRRDHHAHATALDEVDQVFRTVAAGEALKVMVEIGQEGQAQP